MNEFRRACDEQESEIDMKAAQYVRSGMAPWNAYQKAVDFVRSRKRPVTSVDELVTRIISVQYSCR